MLLKAFYEYQTASPTYKVGLAAVRCLVAKQRGQIQEYNVKPDRQRSSGLF